MTIHGFAPGDDPGSSFTELLRRSGLNPPVPTAAHRQPHPRHHVRRRPLRRRRGDGGRPAHQRQPDQPPHDGEGVPRRPVLRRRHRGAAGPAMEMVKLFQLQLEHYEKVEGNFLSLEGKANQLGQMVRSNLPAAMQGLAVVPIFAGYDLRKGAGPPVPVRRHRRSLRGEQLREHGLGQPARRHRREARLPRRSRPGRHHRPGDLRAVPGGRRGLRHRRAPTRARHLPDDRHHHGERLRAGAPRKEIAERFRALGSTVSPPPPEVSPTSVPRPR